MREIILAKYGEIILKGQNRPRFEKLLVKNIKRALPSGSEVSLAQATIYIEPKGDFDEATEKVSKIFGIVSVSRAAVLPKDINEIQKGAASYLSDILSQGATFKVETKRADKSFPLKSPEINALVGEFLLDGFKNLKVDVKNPQIEVRVEVREGAAFVHAGQTKGAGGLPVGSGGEGMLLLSGGIDSPVAGYMMAKRGLWLEAVHFYSPPYTGELARQKALDLAGILAKYTGGLKVHMIPFTNQQLAIRDNCPSEFLTIIMRRMMMMVAEGLSRGRAGALITGESLGQVASQTLTALAATNAAVSLPVFRPLIGMDKDEIVSLARKIGTFETSILPYEDCCTVFVPRRPATKPRLEKVLFAEGKIDIEGLCAEAISNAREVWV